VLFLRSLWAKMQKGRAYESQLERHSINKINKCIFIAAVD
jgi:hypothetical protein